jgi:hypothetical protein
MARPNAAVAERRMVTSDEIYMVVDFVGLKTK